jgi:hypothetical protein
MTEEISLTKEIMRDRYKRLHDLPYGLLSVLCDMLFNRTDKLYLTGGMAAQIYTPTGLHRGSTDLDITPTRRYTWTEFKSEFSDYASELEDLGYKVSFIQGNHCFTIRIEDIEFDNIDPAYSYFEVDFPKWTKSYFERYRSRIRREWQNSRIRRLKIPGEKTVAFRVLDPIDLVLRKLHRIRNYYIHEGIEKYDPPVSLTDHLDEIWEERDKL